MQKQQLLLHQPNGGSEGKVFACNVGDLGSIPGSGRSLEKEMATHSCIFAWRILWTEEPGGLQSMGSQRVRHDWVTSLSLLIVLLGQNLLFWVHASSRSSRGESILCLFQLLRAGTGLQWLHTSVSTSEVMTPSPQVCLWQCSLLPLCYKDTGDGI